MITPAFGRRAIGALALSLLALPALAGGVPACGRLCAAWQLDAAASTDPQAAIDDAVDEYKEEKPRRRRASPSDFSALAKAELDESLGPMHERPFRDELRAELTRRLVIPETLRVSQEGGEIRLDEGRGAPRRFDLEEPYSRVDSLGTAQISAKFQGGNLTIREDYKKKGANREVYSLDTRSDRLTVTRTIQRPSMPDIIVKSIYRPGF
jgi:hypothetical protein